MGSCSSASFSVCSFFRFSILVFVVYVQDKLVSAIASNVASQLVPHILSDSSMVHVLTKARVPSLPSSVLSDSSMVESLFGVRAPSLPSFGVPTQVCFFRFAVWFVVVIFFRMLLF